MGGPAGYERPAIAGSGTIACGLAACATRTAEVRLLARSDASAWRAEEQAQGEARKIDGGDPARIRVTTDPADLADCAGVAERAHAWCAALGKTAVEVPDQPGFVVNRLLFPMLFEAVRLMEKTGMKAAEVDSCMKL